MAFTGRPALEAVDENTGLDAWAAKALDGLALTPTPAVQQEVSQDPFTGSHKDAESPTRQAAQAGLYLSSPLHNGKSLRKAAFSKTQWRTYPNRPRCNVCTNSDRAFSAAVKKLPPLPATVAVSVSTSASSATVSVSVAP